MVSTALVYGFGSNYSLMLCYLILIERDCVTFISYVIYFLHIVGLWVVNSPEMQIYKRFTKQYNNKCYIPPKQLHEI
jgi:hypothetical protein